MARARNIKPSFFLNEELVELPFSTRLLFIGLWTIADREGRLCDKPRQIKMAVFPGDNIDVDKGLQELADAKFIARYTVKAEKYISILNFSKHQNPHVKEAASTIPAPCSPRTRTRRAMLIPESKTDSPFLNPESNTEPDEPREASFAEQVLDGIRSELGILQITKESDWLIEIEVAQKNGFTVEHCIETFCLMNKQDWRDTAIRAGTWSEQLPILHKLRTETERKNGKTKQPSEREKSASRTINADRMADALANGDEATLRSILGMDGQDHIKGYLPS